MVNFYELTIKNDFDNQKKKKIIILCLTLIIFVLITLFIILFFNFYFKKSKGCRDGLIQLRYKDTYELIQCQKNNTFDSCSLISENEFVECSENDYGNFNVCCGTPELLVQILTKTISISHFNSLGKRKIEVNNKRPSTFFKTSSNNIDLNMKNNENIIPYINDQIKEESSYYDNNENDNLMSIEKLFDSKRFVNRINYQTNYDTEGNLYLQKKENSIKPNVEDIDLKLKIGKNNDEKGNSITFDVKTGPILSIISNGLYYPGNITNLWNIETSVVLFKENNCTVIVNTGMPFQKNNIKDSLISKGNIELFPTQNLVLETNLANKDSVLSILWYEMGLYKLCSPNLSIIKTPGVTENSITVIAKNVPGMGTVAVGGNLFFSDKNLFKIERNFIQNDTALLSSRKKIVCLSDWIVPAYGNPVIVTKKMKYDMSC
uniref:Beta-sarcoglycan n=1 Tax=Strongyloides stercoralis TaxID=6248 RepID=A0A0K0EHV6_STRER